MRPMNVIMPGISMPKGHPNHRDSVNVHADVADTIMMLKLRLQDKIGIDHQLLIIRYTNKIILGF